MCRSLERDLRSDDFLRLLQKERLVEAPLSFMLQMYSTFWLTTNSIAYILAIFSMLGSLLSVATACFIYFDLAIDPDARMSGVEQGSQSLSEAVVRLSSAVSNVSSEPARPAPLQPQGSSDDVLRHRSGEIAQGTPPEDSAVSRFSAIIPPATVGKVIGAQRPSGSKLSI